MNHSLAPKLLIVENDALTYDNLVSFFKSKDYPVVETKDGSIIESYGKALEMAALELPDIAILDVELNGKEDGLQLGKKLSDLYDMPILFLTGYDTPENNKIAMGISTIPLFSKVAKIEDNIMILKSLNLLYHRYIIPSLDAPYKRKSARVEIDKDNYNKINYEDEVKMTSVEWKDVRFVSSYNSSIGKGNNHVILHTQKHIGYRIHANLKNLVEVELPDYFQRISNSAIINLRHLTRKDYNTKTCTINGYTLDITKSYEKEAIRRIESYLNSKYVG